MSILWPGPLLKSDGTVDLDTPHHIIEYGGGIDKTSDQAGGVDTVAKRGEGICYSNNWGGASGDWTNGVFMAETRGTQGAIDTCYNHCKAKRAQGTSAYWGGLFEPEGSQFHYYRRKHTISCWSTLQMYMLYF